MPNSPNTEVGPVQVRSGTYTVNFLLRYEFMHGTIFHASAKICAISRPLFVPLFCGLHPPGFKTFPVPSTSSEDPSRRRAKTGIWHPAGIPEGLPEGTM